MKRICGIGMMQLLIAGGSFVVALPASSENASLGLLRNRLVQMRATTPIAGRLEIEERITGKSSVRRGTMRFECDEANLKTVTSIEDLSKTVDPRSRNVIEIHSRNVWERVDAARALLMELEGAEVLQEKSELWRGRRVKVLKLRLDPEKHLDKEDLPKGARMKIESTQTLWIDTDDSTPLESEIRTHMSARFLVISSKGDLTAVAKYAVMGDRLVTMGEVTEAQSSGMGQKETSTSTATLILEPIGVLDSLQQ